MTLTIPETTLFGDAIAKSLTENWVKNEFQTCSLREKKKRKKSKKSHVIKWIALTHNTVALK